ncbi:MAG: hypothetical protein QXX12_01970 [Nanopusillaceae archaeon]
MKKEKREKEKMFLRNLHKKALLFKGKMNCINMILIIQQKQRENYNNNLWYAGYGKDRKDKTKDKTNKGKKENSNTYSNSMQTSKPIKEKDRIVRKIISGSEMVI